jgi:chemotaxis protein MotB
MKMKYSFLIVGLASFTMISCVSKKKMQQSEEKYKQLDGAYLDVQSKLRACEGETNGLKSSNTDLTKQLADTKSSSDAKIADLNKQIDFLKQNNTTVLSQLKDLSVISGSQAESIKKSLDNIGSKDAYIQDLQSALARKDSLNMALVMNLKGAIGNLDDKDINIKVDKDVVYIDISDKLLFKSGSYDITDRAKVVLGKVAKVLAAQPGIEFMVEGHTDTIPYKGPVILDNWDLSTKRATSVIRILQNQYGLDPKRMTAAGRGEYVSIADNSTPEGRATNRRTRIVILPQLDQFFKLLEKK